MLAPRGPLPGARCVGNRRACRVPPHLAELMTLKRDDIPASKLDVAAKSLHKDNRALPLNPQDRCWHFQFVGAKELASAAEIGSPADPFARSIPAPTQFLAIKQAQPQAPIGWKRDRGLFFAAACEIINQLEHLMRCC